MKIPPAVPELLRRKDRFQRVITVTAAEIVGMLSANQPILDEREPCLRVRALVREEAGVV